MKIHLLINWEKQTIKPIPEEGAEEALRQLQDELLRSIGEDTDSDDWRDNLAQLEVLEVDTLTQRVGNKEMKVRLVDTGATIVVDGESFCSVGFDESPDDKQIYANVYFDAMHEGKDIVVREYR